MRAFNSSPAKEPPLFRFAAPSIIDLTNDSDSDDDIKPRDVHKPRFLKRDAATPNNHGLILPGSLLLSNAKGEGNQATASTSPQSHISNRTGGTVIHERKTLVPHPAKRRKTEGGSTGYRTVQKPVTVFKREIPIQAPSARVSAVDGYENDPRMHNVIKDHVIYHIQLAISQYRNSISKGDRDRIARKAGAKIVTREDFVPNFEANSFTLSNDYKIKIAKRADSYISDFAKEFLANLGPQYNNENNSSNASSAGTITHPTSRNNSSAAISARSSAFEISIPSRPGPNKKPVPAPRANLSSRSSSESTSRDNIDGQRHYSSSPTTSFTNDAPDDHERKLVVQQADRQSNLFNVEPPHIGAIRQRRTKTRRNAKPQPSTSTSTNPLLHSISSADQPYLSYIDRQYIRRGLRNNSIREEGLEGLVLHMDFSIEELQLMRTIIQEMVHESQYPHTKDRPLPPSHISALIRDNKLQVSQICSKIKAASRTPGEEPSQQILLTRSIDSIHIFLKDAAAGRLPVRGVPSMLRVCLKEKKRLNVPAPTISLLVREREIWGLAPQRVSNGQQPFGLEFSNYLEDSLIRKSEWTDCCGDISAISWTSDSAFICGATAHSDFHNMQYNKPGNLGVGSCTLDTLRSVPNHRTMRPIIDSAENSENSLEAMRQTQDPWLYTSVVSTAHSEFSGLTFTASFDQTVKVWKVAKEGASMKLIGTWEHDGKVNFVVTSNWHAKVATASDVSSNAIRIYDLNQDDVGRSLHYTYSGDRAQEQAIEMEMKMELERKDAWAYYPATINWGISPLVRNLLLVGYSPRSISGDEMDIPEEKRNSGELCLWDATNGERIRISSAHLQNVFEVIWHPTQPVFIAATSPCGPHEPAVIKTQVRLFAQNQLGTFLQVKALDCTASDINELTVMPNGNVECFVTASCTDGNSYVWDTAQGDRPIHTLGHGESLDNPLHDVPREIADTGVKFAAWGQALRFYTGSSDGKVKVWDITAPKRQAYVKTVLSVSGGVSSGAFSKDFSKLVVGDATGKVHLLEVERDKSDDETPQERAPAKVARAETPWLRKAIPGKKAPKVIIPHRDSTPPDEKAEDLARIFLEEGQLRLQSDRTVGAVQGPNYAETMLYRFEAHEHNDTSRPLRPEIQARQREEVNRMHENRDVAFPRLSENIRPSSTIRHARNNDLELHLSVVDKQELERDGVDFRFMPEDDFEYDLSIRTKKFKVEMPRNVWRDRDSSMSTRG